MFRTIALLLALFSQALPAQAPAPSPPVATHPVSLDELYSEPDVVDAAISPSGRYLAVVMRRATDDILVVMDLHTNDKKIITYTKPEQAGKKLYLHMSTVYWKTDERLLFRVTIRPDESLVLNSCRPSSTCLAIGSLPSIATAAS